MSAKVYRADVWLKLMKENKTKEKVEKPKTKTRQSNKKSTSKKGDK